MTKQQHRLYTYLQAYMGEHGYAPSLDEMKAALDIRSKSNVRRLLHCLEDRGLIERRPKLARAIEIVHHTCPHCGGRL